MAPLDERRSKPRLILDAGAILALERGDVTARAALVRARRERRLVVIPTPVVTQVHRGGRARAAMDRVLNTVDRFEPTTIGTARRAGELLGLAGMSDAVDAIVVAVALGSKRATILTSDPDDLRRLVDAEDGAEVHISPV